MKKLLIEDIYGLILVNYDIDLLGKVCIKGAEDCIVGKYFEPDEITKAFTNYLIGVIKEHLKDTQ